MKLTTTTIVTLDGVMQGLGTPDEDRRGGFERGGWAAPYTDGETMTALNRIYGRADAFLLGRKTYEIFSASWGSWRDPGDSPVWTALNTKPKYVASTTLSDPEWDRTTILSGDVPAAVRDLKAGSDGELQVHGSGKLVRWLLDQELIDELILVTIPVVVGQGMRLFPEKGPDIALALIDSKSAANGVTIQTYRPDGRPEYGNAASDAEMELAS